MAQPPLEIPLVAGIFLIFNKMEGVSKMARTTPRRMARPTLVGRVMADSLKPCRFFSQISRTDVCECRARRCEDRTLRRMHRDTDACVVHVPDHPTHVCCSFAHPKSHPLTTCFIVHSLMYHSRKNNYINAWCRFFSDSY